MPHTLFAQFRSSALWCRIFFYTMLVGLSMGGAPLWGADAKEISFDLPVDALSNSVKRFAAQSGLEVLVSSDALAQVRTRAVRGEMTARQALDAMLAGTGLTVLQDPKTGAFAIWKKARGADREKVPPDAGASSAKKKMM